MHRSAELLVVVFFFHFITMICNPEWDQYQSLTLYKHKQNKNTKYFLSDVL